MKKFKKLEDNLRILLTKKLNIYYSSIETGIAKDEYWNYLYHAYTRSNINKEIRI